MYLTVLHHLGPALLGGALGYAWHRVVGCASGACPLTANPYTATLYGAMVGLMATGARA